MTITQQTQEVPSTRDKVVTKDDVLRLIPQFEISPIFLRPHLDREIVAGSIGDRGGGKSAMDAVTAIVDYMFSGKSVYSNMVIKCDIEIDNETARNYGLNSGGVVHYEATPLEKDALLRLDDRYRNSCIVIEEINVQYSNVRRFMSNTNVDFNEVCQQLRKFKTSLLYNVIDEMFIDPQLRALTDFFVKTYDTAFDLDALAAKKKTGIGFRWKVYPMSGYLAGEQGKYVLTHRALPPIYFHFAAWRGIFNTGKHQEKGLYSMSTKEKNKRLMAQVSVESSGEMVEQVNEWAWLAEKAQELKSRGVKTIQPWELALYLERRVNQDIKDALKTWGIHYDRFIQAYRVDDYTLSETQRIK